MANKMKRIINGRERTFTPLLTKSEIITIISLIVVFIAIGLLTQNLTA